jgi:hypothetical protein
MFLGLTEKINPSLEAIQPLLLKNGSPTSRISELNQLPQQLPRLHAYGSADQDEIR